MSRIGPATSMRRLSTMTATCSRTEELMARLRQTRNLARRESLLLVVLLSIPSIIAQLASVLMHYIDAAMLGHLGADAAAAVGLVSTTIWLFWGLGSAGISGFHVLAGHAIGAQDAAHTRHIVRQSILIALMVGLLFALIAIAIAPHLPYWLGGEGRVATLAGTYFQTYVGAWPLVMFNFLLLGLLRVSGDMKTASALGILMCTLNVVFNFICIFPTQTIVLGTVSFCVPGLGWGVVGAAWATIWAIVCVDVIGLYFVCFRNRHLAICHEAGSFLPSGKDLAYALRIGIPIGLQRIGLNGAQVASTMIVAPLGTIAIAAHSFAITVESLCYMPGFGIRESATTLTAQSFGANAPDLARRLGGTSIAVGVVVMTFMGAVMYFGADSFIGIMTPDRTIVELGSTILRIEALVEPMFALSIVAYGCFLGAGDTLTPSLMTMGSMWLVRLPVSFYLAQTHGLVGVWIAMAGELFFRGCIFFWRFLSGRWLRSKNAL